MISNNNKIFNFNLKKFLSTKSIFVCWQTLRMTFKICIGIYFVQELLL